MNDTRKAPPLAGVPIPDLLRQLSTDTATLVRQEFALARAEIGERASAASKAATGFGTAAIFALGAFGAITLAVIALLHLAMPLWLASLIVAVAYAGIAAGAAARGKKLFANAAASQPERTIESVREDLEAVRAGIARGR